MSEKKKTQTEGYMDIIKDMKSSEKKVPMCWKCTSRITAPSNDKKSLSLVGCSECKEIKSYSDAEKMCPLLFPKKNKVLIIINGGCASVEYKPDHIEIEIRDYDTDGVDEAVLTTDEEGDEYQEMIFEAETEKVVVELDPIEPDEPIKYINYYRCPDCNEEWQDEWSCTCDDECPTCGIPYTPYKSEDINKEE